MSYSRKQLPLAGSKNLVVGLVDRLNLLCRWDQRQFYTDQMRSTLIQQNVMKLELDPLNELGVNFNVRITALCWGPPNFPYIYAVGSKHGDIVVASVDRAFNGANGNLGWTKQTNKAEIKGSGGGNSITAMQFDENYPNIFYRTSIDSTVSRVDLQHASNALKYWDFDSYQQWFTSMDINFKSRILIAGDNKGSVKLFNLSDGKSLGSHRFHSSKIHDIQFSKRDPNILVTAGLETARRAAPVKIWDMRMLLTNKPLLSLHHNSAVNVARFNPTDGSQLLTSDQDNEIRVYSFLPSLVGEPEPMIIEHRHKQFQHITQIKASWHPLADLIVIGKYPKAEYKIRKTIEFFNPKTGNCVGEILQPQDKIVSLNAFNPTGELLASAMSSELLIWRPSTKKNEDAQIEGNDDEDDDLPQLPPDLNLSQAVRDRLRGKNTRTARANTNNTFSRYRRAREYSPVSDDEENEENGKKTKRAKKAPATATSKKTKTTSKKKK